MTPQTLTIPDDDTRVVLLIALDKFQTDLRQRQVGASYFLKDHNPEWERQRTIAQTLLSQLEEGIS
jgi:hypothetical protein